MQQRSRMKIKNDAKHELLKHLKNDRYFPNFIFLELKKVYLIIKYSNDEKTDKYLLKKLHQLSNKYEI